MIFFKKLITWYNPHANWAIWANIPILTMQMLPYFEIFLFISTPRMVFRIQLCPNPIASTPVLFTSCPLTMGSFWNLCIQNYYYLHANWACTNQWFLPVFQAWWIMFPHWWFAVQAGDDCSFRECKKGIYTIHLFFSDLAIGRCGSNFISLISSYRW